MKMMNKAPSSARPHVKIAYIGGGSRYWARDLMKDLALQAPFDGELALYDIHHAAALKNVEIADQIFARKEAVSRFKAEAIETLEAALKGADFVVMSIEPGPMQLRYADLEIPLKYGLYQPVGDTVGPGGLLRALRTIPTYQHLARKVAEICPDAWVINYTNPMTLCTRALFAEWADIKAFGCCHEVFGTQTRLAKLAGEALGLKDVKRHEVKVDVTGVNHFTWVTAAKCRGVDLMPALREHIAKPEFVADATADSLERVEKKQYFHNRGHVSFDLCRRFGALAAAGDRHLVEFVPWYARDEETLQRWGVICTPYQFRIDSRSGEDVASGSYAQDEINPSGEEGVQQMAGLLGIEDLDTNVNLPNRGQAPDLPLEAVVETNAAFRQDGLTPIVANALPPAAALLVQRVVGVQELTLKAAFARDLGLAREALLADPLVTLSPDRVYAMFDEMVEHIGDYLKPFGYK